jgi:hypothetical protein
MADSTAASNLQPASIKPTEEKQAAVQPSGPRGDNPATAGPGQTGVRSSTPENAPGALNPSAPGETGTVPPGTK